MKIGNENIKDPIELQKYIKRKIKYYDRTISWQHRQYQVNIDKNSISHPKLDLPMVLRMTVPNTTKYMARLRKWKGKLKENTKVLRWWLGRWWRLGFH